MSKPLHRTQSDPPPAKEYVEKIMIKTSVHLQKDKDYNDYNYTSSSLYSSTSSIADLEVISQSSFETPKEIKSSNAGQKEDDEEIVSVNKCKIDFSKLEFVKQIGSGAFGIVWKARYLGVNVAVKSVDSSSDPSDFLNEVSVLKALRHPNIVLFLGYTLSPRLCIITEYMKNGNLSRMLQDFTKNIDSQKILAISLSVARGMFYLHSQHPTIIHRDLKSGNVLIDGNWNIKVADYGLSVIAHDDQQNQFLGDAKWRAPEHIKEKNNYTIKSDVFSYGVLLWELLTRKEPYVDEAWGVAEILRNVRLGYRLKIPSTCPPMLKELITKCWAQNPEDRPDFDGVITTLEVFAKDASFQQLRSFSEVVSLLEMENNNKKPSMDNPVPQFQRAQVMSSIFQLDYAVKGVESFMKQVLPLVKSVTNYVWLLVNKDFGKFMVVFVYPQGASSTDSDKVALQHKHLATEYAKMFCTPIVRETMVLLELVDFDNLPSISSRPGKEVADSGKEEDKTATPKPTLKQSNNDKPPQNDTKTDEKADSPANDKNNPDYKALHRVNYLSVSGEEDVDNVLNNALRKSGLTDNSEDTEQPVVDEEFLKSLPTLPPQQDLPEDCLAMTLTLRETEFNNSAHKNIEAFKSLIPLMVGTGIKRLMLLNAPAIHKVIFVSRWENEAALKRAIAGGLLHRMLLFFKDKMNCIPTLEFFHFVQAPHCDPQ